VWIFGGLIPIGVQQKYSQSIPSQCHLVYHKSKIKFVGIELVFRGEGWTANGLAHVMVDMVDMVAGIVYPSVMFL